MLVALLARELGSFAVPSNTSAPRARCSPPCRRTTRRPPSSSRLGSGIVVDPDDLDGFLGAAQALLGDPARRAELGRRARAYAERRFAIGGIADCFEDVLWPGAQELRIPRFQHIMDRCSRAIRLRTPDR
ncbi:MAG: hypothetical protein ACYDA3_07480 [Gaiellaceae bacterium]